MPKSRQEDDIPEVNIPGEWLFKVSDVVYGPAPPRLIVERLFRGEIDGDTLAAPADGDWSPLRRIPAFRDLVAQAEEQRHRDKVRAAHRKVETFQRVRNFLLISGPVAVLLLSGALVFNMYKQRALRAAGGRPGEGQVDWANRPPPLISLGKFVIKPTRRLSEAELEERKRSYRLRLLTLKEKRKKQKEKLLAMKGAAGGEKGRAAAEKSGGGEPDGAGAANDDDLLEGDSNMPETLSDVQIQEVIRKNFHNLLPCVREEAKGNPAMASSFVVDFAINNEGRIESVELDDSRYVAGGDLPNCFKRKMGAWRFPKFFGERRNVTLPINVH